MILLFNTYRFFLFSEESGLHEGPHEVSYTVINGSQVYRPQIWKKRKGEWGDSFDPEPGTFGMAKNTCLKWNLVMMLDSSSEGAGTPDNGSLVALLPKELIIYRKKKCLDIDQNPLDWWKVNYSDL